MGENKKIETCCPEKVEMLIQNELSRFTDEDREWLETLTEEQIDKMTPKELPAESENPQMNEAQALRVLEEKLSDPDAFLGLLPEEVREQMQDGMRLYRERRTALIQEIRAYSEVFSEEELTARSTEELEKLAEYFRPEKVSYGGQAAGQAMKTNQAELLLPLGVSTE